MSAKNQAVKPNQLRAFAVSPKGVLANRVLALATSHNHAKTLALDYFKVVKYQQLRAIRPTAYDPMADKIGKPGLILNNNDLLPDLLPFYPVSPELELPAAESSLAKQGTFARIMSRLFGGK